MSGRPPNASLKSRFPFRLGTTSYIVPADIVTNVASLAPRVDDVELVLFESDEISNMPEAGTVQKLCDIAEGAGLSYTVHLPLDIQLGHPEESQRRRSVDKCLRVIERTRPLNPFAYVVHFHAGPQGGVLPDELNAWLARLERSVEDFRRAGIPPWLLCVETLDYPFEAVEGIVLDHGLSICLDVGHVLLNTHPLEVYLDRYFPRCRVVHLHGVREGKDHLAVSEISQDRLGALFSRLCNGDRERVVTLEVFSEADLELSLAATEGFLRCGA